MKILKIYSMILIAGITTHAPYVAADNVYSNEESQVSFRYPDDWSEREPQLQTTLVLLYADNDSGATCNLVAQKVDRLDELSEEQLEVFRSRTNTQESFENSLRDAFLNTTFTNYQRGRLGQKDAGFIEFEHDAYANNTTYRAFQIQGATYANSQRFILTCNSLAQNKKAALDVFSYIRDTMIFMY